MVINIILDLSFGSIMHTGVVKMPHKFNFDADYEQLKYYV